MTPEQEYDARHAEEMGEENIRMMLDMVDKAEKDADGEFNQHEYFSALSTLRSARLLTKDPALKALIDVKLAELDDRYGRLGSY